MQQEGVREPPLPTQELWIVDGFWGRENTWRAPHPGVHWQHTLEDMDLEVKGEEWIW